MTIDLLKIERGLVTAPAGCGKTELISRALKENQSVKPVLVLTHTNAGVAALRGRLDRAEVPPSSYRLSTIDGWVMRLVSTFPARSGCDPAVLKDPNYPAIRDAAKTLLAGKHINDVVEATYSRLFVDEYQDCTIRQHSIICHVSSILPTCVVGDPIQAIFGFGGDGLPAWDTEVCKQFPLAGGLTEPWRWINAGNRPLGDWLLKVRENLINRRHVDLTTAPKGSVNWIELSGVPANDYPILLKAGLVPPPGGTGSVVIIGQSTNPPSQQRYASQTPGAVTVESVDLRDMVSFARSFDLKTPDVVRQVAEFAEKLMTNVGANDLVARVDILKRGTGRKLANNVESAALALDKDRSFPCVSTLLVEINKQPGVRVYRPAVLRSCLRALDVCTGASSVSFHDAAVRMREQNRALGRTLPRRAVGSTLLLKGLEAEVAVLLCADELNARHLYVALTRGSKLLVVCSKNSTLKPSW